MDSYSSEMLFLSSLPVSETFSSLKSLMEHCARIKNDRERILTLSQGLLLHICDFYQDPAWSYTVKKCVDTLRRIPDDAHGNMGYYARHVEQCCLA
jgi:hypothetical protein